jgi:hypothetical protein
MMITMRPDLDTLTALVLGKLHELRQQAAQNTLSRLCSLSASN